MFSSKWQLLSIAFYNCVAIEYQQSQKLTMKLKLIVSIKQQKLIEKNSKQNKDNKTLFQQRQQQMIQLFASIISSSVSTVLLYPAQRIKIQMQLSISKKNHHKEEIVTKQLNELLDLEQQEVVILDSPQEVEATKENIATHQNSSTFPKKYKQKQSYQTNNFIVINNCNKGSLSPHNSSTIKSAIAQIYTKQGWTGFYSGLQSLIIGNGLSYGVYFVIYQKAKQSFGFMPGSVLDTIKCSSVAGIIASIVTNPFWVLQTKQSEQKGTIVQKGRQLILKQGYLAFWKGLSSSLILVSNPIIQFVIYEQLKKVTNIKNDSKLYDLVIFIIGAISKMISTLCTYPLTVVRTKQHVNTDKKKWQHITKEIYKSDGLKGFFKGIEPKLIQTVLNSALLLMLFQKIRTILVKYMKSKGI